MREPIEVGGMRVEPGERAFVHLPISSQYMHNQVGLPVHVLHGRNDGPRLFLSAAIHGDELCGIEIIRRVLANPAMRKLSGTLIAVPVVNGFGFMSNSRYLPDRRDLNRTFPGSLKGSLGSRIAYHFLNDVVKHCTHGIDLHTAAEHRINLPQVRGNLDDPVTRWLAQAFDVPVLISAKLRDGSLREATAARGLPMLVYEGGQALRYDEFPIRAGVRGVNQVMKALGMLPSKEPLATSVRGTIAKSTKWVRAPEGGVLRAETELGERVVLGQPLGHIYDPFGFRELAIEASASGLIIGRTNLPTVNEGDALFHIANFEQDGDVASAVENFGESLDPESDRVST